MEPSARMGIIGVVHRPLTCWRAHAFASGFPTGMAIRSWSPLVASFTSKTPAPKAGRAAPSHPASARSRPCPIALLVERQGGDPGRYGLGDRGLAPHVAMTDALQHVALGPRRRPGQADDEPDLLLPPNVGRPVEDEQGTGDAREVLAPRAEEAGRHPPPAGVGLSAHRGGPEPVRPAASGRSCSPLPSATNRAASLAVS